MDLARRWGSPAQWNAAIAVDGSNSAYAVWQDDRNGRNTPDTDIYFSKRTAGAWSSNVRVNDDTKAVTQRNPRIAAKSDGAATAVWVDFRSSQWNIYSSRLATGGSAWAANLRVTDNTTSRKDSPDVAVAPDGTAYAVWEDDRSGNWDVWYATLAPGAAAWSVNRKVSDDPGTGRLTSRDPVLGDARAPVSMNRYAYAGANPIRNADPTGLWCSGGLGSFTAAMGLWVAPGGAATMSGIGFGYCHDELTGANQLGWFKYGGKFSSQDDIQRTIGLYAGIGAGVWWSPNAQSFSDISGPFLTGSIGTAVSPEIQYSIGENGIEMYSGTLGPGLILEYTILIKNTEILGTINLGPSAPAAPKGW